MPAIDIKGGKCVRLVQGAREAATEYYAEPLDAAARWSSYPIRRVHVVDLDGAFSGAPVNRGKILELAALLAGNDIEVQVGGGVRDAAGAAAYLEHGVSRAILGTLAVKEPALFAELARAFPGRINLALDCRQGRLATDGWGQRSEVTAGDLLAAFEALPLGEVIYTEVSRDGTLNGLAVAGLREIVKASRWPVIASGGVAGVTDVEAARAAAAWGIIIGKALYDGRLDLAAALAAAE